MGAERVQGERTHRAWPADTKRPTLICFSGPWELGEHGKILRAQCEHTGYTRRVSSNERKNSINHGAGRIDVLALPHDG